MARLTNTEIEERWYDLFCGWKKSDRAAAIKALTQLHPRLPDNPKPWLITEEIIDQAIAAAEAGHINGLTYNQSSWCGTACCVLGFARHIAGLPSRGTGPLDEEFAKSRRITTLRSLMRCPSPAILAIMRKVGTDGKIDLSGAVLRGADLRRADLLGGDLRGADLRGANLSCAVLRGAVLLDAVLRGANLSDANLSGAVLRGAVLRRAVLLGADLLNADLRGANLSGAVLSGAVLRGAVLRDAVLRRADLLGADLLNADLRGANLSGAVLRGAVLSDAFLRGAVLSGADLRGAVRWDGAKYVPVTPEWLKERGAIL